VTDEQIANITYESDPVELEEPTHLEGLSLPEGPVHWHEGPVADRDRLLRYCVVASLILHVLAFTVVPRMAAFQQSSTALTHRETRTPVRIVQLPQNSKKDEPPPKNASAMSDRNHTAEKERLPKAIPSPPRPPIGKIEPQKQRIASVMPPPAPEAFVKEREPQPKKPQPSKPLTREKTPSKPSATKPPDRKYRKPTKEDLKHMNVDLRPTTQDMQKAFSSQAGGSDFYPDGEVEEAVVDINTREDRFFSYLLSLKRKIEAVWIYPQTAARAGIGGTLTLEFVIAKEGKLEHVNLLDSSGHAILDESAQSAIKAAAPYNPFPPSLRAKRLRIRANFIYVTSDFFKRVL
jgi:periplasmic protein TonB